MNALVVLSSQLSSKRNRVSVSDRRRLISGRYVCEMLVEGRRCLVQLPQCYCIGPLSHDFDGGVRLCVEPAFPSGSSEFDCIRAICDAAMDQYVAKYPSADRKQRRHAFEPPGTDRFPTGLLKNRDARDMRFYE